MLKICLQYNWKWYWYWTCPINGLQF